MDRPIRAGEITRGTRKFEFSKAPCTIPPGFHRSVEDGGFLLLETRGQDADQDETKREFLEQWVKAVNEPVDSAIGVAR